MSTSIGKERTEKVDWLKLRKGNEGPSYRGGEKRKVRKRKEGKNRKRGKGSAFIFSTGFFPFLTFLRLLWTLTPSPHSLGVEAFAFSSGSVVARGA